MTNEEPKDEKYETITITFTRSQLALVKRCVMRAFNNERRADGPFADVNINLWRAAKRKLGI